MKTTIELVYHEGCANVPRAREHLRRALKESGLPLAWEERRQEDRGTPDALRRYGSPTVLVAGRDVTGAGPGDGGACRADGAPSVEAIKEALAGTGR